MYPQVIRESCVMYENGRRYIKSKRCKNIMVEDIERVK